MSEREQLRYWKQGLKIAERWYHEEWDGSEIQLCLAEDIAEGIEREVASIEKGSDMAEQPKLTAEQEKAMKKLAEERKRRQAQLKQAEASAPEKKSK